MRELIKHYRRALAAVIVGGGVPVLVEYERHRQGIRDPVTYVALLAAALGLGAGAVAARVCELDSLQILRADDPSPLIFLVQRLVLAASGALLSGLALSTSARGCTA